MRTQGLPFNPLVALLELRRNPVDVPDSYLDVFGWTVPWNQVLFTACAAGAVKSARVVFLPFVETSSVMASGTSTGLVL